MEARSVSSSEYYWNYHGQRIDHLNAVHASLRENGCKSSVWLAGDSSLDNKHWLFNGESTLGQRLEGEGHGLLPQDEFIRDHITEDDVLIVDLGGNDVALRPTTWTALNMAALIYLSATCVIRSLSFAVAPCNGWYCGFPLGLGYFVNMFKNKTTAYIEKVIEKRKPKKVVVCMLYYLDQNPSGSWADKILGLLGYDKDPAKLKAVIKRVYELGTSAIRIPGVEVVAFPLFTALDGTDATDYIARVEPSVQGGRKMAEALLPAVLGRGMPSPE
mmetsp:Transcript_57722/g.187513  ORF Transcript_57722/g.187513 Transcript_57722/m.187513 type:complete len:273 (+) Transcript_57722:172-990(+)